VAEEVIAPGTPAGEVGRIVDELRRAHDGDPWHGSPVRDVLAGVSADVAARRPIPGAHTVWEIVLHMTAWRREVARRLRTGVADVPADGDWPPVGGDGAGDGAGEEAAWEAALAALDAAHAELVRAVAALPESRLDEPLGDRRDRPAGTGVSYYVMLHGVAQHDAYHAGQIALLRKGG
jgi:uncharacterized damage-inducible protein DinB